MTIRSRYVSNIVLVLALSATLPLLASSAAQHRSTNQEADDVPPVAQTQAQLKLQPGNSRLYIKLGRAYWNQSDYQKAFEALKQAVKLAPASAEAHNWMGAFLMGRGNLPDAISELHKATSLDSNYARAFTNLGSALAKSGDMTGSVSAFQKALTLEPNSWTAHLNLGLALRENGDASGALPHLRRVATAQPKNATVQCELGKTLRQSGDLNGALVAFNTALELDPQMRDAYYGLGFTLKQEAAATRKAASLSLAVNPAYQKAQNAVSSGDLNSAKGELLGILSTDDGNADAHNLLGYVLGQQGDTSTALQHLGRAASLRPDSAEIHYNYGAALWYSGAKEQGISELKRTVQLDPSAGAGYALLGIAQRDMGDFVASGANLKRAIALSPTVAANFIDLGIVFLRQNELNRALGQFEAGLSAASPTPTPDWDSAISGLREMEKKTPNRPDVHDVLGLLLGRKGAASEEVLREFREALRLQPNFAEAHNHIGLVLAQSGEDEKAVAEFREAVKLQPDYPDAHANLGAALMLSDVEQAIGELQKAVSLDPTLVTAQFNLSEAYGNSPAFGPEKQIEQLRKILSIVPDFGRAHLALGKALLRSGNANEAIQELHEATRLDPESGEAHYQLGLALARGGQQEQGNIEVKRGRELSAADDRNQNAEIDLSEGRNALVKGELQEAEAKFKHAIRLQPDSPAAHHLLALTLEKEGDGQNALTEYQKAVELNPGDTVSKAGVSRLQPIPDAPERSVSMADLSATHLEGSQADDPTQVSRFEDYIRLNRFAEVEPLLAGYVSDHPNSSWGWYALGYSQFAQKKVGESIKALAKSLGMDVKNAEAHKILGRDLMVIGRFDAAQTEFEQAIQYAPSAPENHYDLGKLFSLQDNWEAARKQFEDAIRINPSYLEALNSLGFAEEALGDDPAAVRTYEKTIALNEQQRGKFVSAHVNLSAYYNRTGDLPKALDYAEKALSLDPKSDPAWFQKARAEERKGDLQAAADSLNHAIEINPRSSSYYYVLSGIYRRLGNMEESKKALDSFTRLDQENNELEKMRRSMSKSRNAPRPGGGRE